ncbi:MAG: hypothetical protein H6766_00100 [Candidatus Peribacteria bacterium]|nr:MAG: hypothetical protein H6766_00100 [Candidatus Peribacteria bacterium]
MYQPQIIDQIITKTLTGAFGVSDTVGSNTGRYTTLQASDMIGLNDTIAASNLAISHP